jgi:signal transduction histidine kinase
VRDNGIGIEPQYREQVFGLFTRLHGTEFHSGTGIGLAICQCIIERYHGRIWSSQNLERDRTSVSRSPSDRGGSQARRIVVVEDSRPDVKLIRMALAKSEIDAEIMVFEDGEKAVRFFENAEAPSHYPDLVLLDMNLPRLKGREVLSCIRGADAEVCRF